MIKVITKSTQQAIEIIEAFKDTTADLTIEIKNTTAENSDVNRLTSKIITKKKYSVIGINNGYLSVVFESH